MKKLNKIILLLIVAIIFCSCSKNTETTSTNVTTGKIHIVDDTGSDIYLEEPAKKIISLYSAHTENLYAIGLKEEIIGVGKSDAYPYDVTKKKIFDYRSDPEKIIAAEPDLVLIRPFINKSKPELVESLKNAGVTVVSLYPSSFDKFSDYIMKLGTITGYEVEAKTRLNNFYSELDVLKKAMVNQEKKTKVFFESTETNYRTITTDSMAAKAIEYAGGVNVADDAVPMREGTTIASYGIERILEKAEDIEVYISQRGAMNSGGNLHSISIRPGFDALKALQDERVYTINEKLVSSPTFRFTKGVKELSRMFYPEIVDDLSIFKIDEKLDRRTLAKMAVMAKHKGIFAPTSKYYTKDRRGHVYGSFEDIKLDDKDYDYIETAVMSSYVEYDQLNFNPDTLITREDLAKSIYIMFELENKDEININIEDIETCDKKNIVETIVKNNVIELQENKFNPEAVVSMKEAVTAIEKAKKISMN